MSRCRRREPRARSADHAARAQRLERSGPAPAHRQAHPRSRGPRRGSSDAAAALALLASRAGIADHGLLRELARDLGSDVAGLISPGRWLATGAGDELEELPSPVGLWVLVLPADHGLSTADVYARADEIGSARSRSELDELAQRLLDELAGGADLPPAELMQNDLEDAALSLDPSIAASLQRASRAGADHVMVAGSGPTVVGLFAGAAARSRCRAAARAVTADGNTAIWVQAM